MIAQLNRFVFLIFVELAVVTPVERRTFVSVAPATTKSKLSPIFVSKFLFGIYIIGEKAKNRTKNGQKLSKKELFFLAPPSIWLSLT